MSQNLVNLKCTPEDISAMMAAVDTLEEKFSNMIDLSVSDRRRLAKMGDRSEAFCRQTLILLDQNRQIIPPGMDLDKAEEDLRLFDVLRPIFARLHVLMTKAEDTEMALGSDILSAALDGYALAKLVGKGAGLDVLREAMSLRLSRKSKGAESPAT